MANISNRSNTSKGYRRYEYDGSGMRVEKISVWKTEADYLSSTVDNTNKIQTINYNYDMTCRLTSVVETYGTHLDGTNETVRKVLTHTYNYDGGSPRVESEETI